MKYTEKEVVELFNEYHKWTHLVTNVKDFLKEKGLIKEEFEVGKWYKSNTNCLLNYVSNERCYGFNYLGNWVNNNEGWNDCYDWELATDKEVEDALIKEAKKLIGKGVVKCLHECDDIYSMEDVNYFDWDGKCLRVYLKGSLCCVFDEGKWATIIEEPKVDKMNEVLNKAIKELRALKNK